jgi:hypothetical protein
VADDPILVAQRNNARYIRARDNGHAKYVEAAAKHDGFYTGEGHWDPATKAKLEAEGRPALTFNMVLAVINTALGEQLRRDVMFNFKPRRSGTRGVASILNKLTMQILQANRYKYVEFMTASDGLIQGRGYIDVRMKFEQHMQGEVAITSLDPTTVVLDPDAKEYDPATWNEVIITRWMSIDEIAGVYGKDKADSLQSRVASGESLRYDSVKFEEKTFGDGAMQGQTYVYDKTDDNRDIRSVRVVERQYYKWTPELMFVDPETGDMAEVPQGWSKKKAEKFAQQAQLFLHKRPGRKVRWTVSADHVLLFDDWSIYKTFTVVPFFPYFRRGQPFGMMSNLIGPQEYLNKTRSQELHIVNTTANSGWTLEEGTLVNMTTDELQQRGAETGLILEHARGSNPPQKIQPNSVPSGLDRISEKAAYSIREISGVNDGMMGFAAPSVSGVALDRKTTQGQVQLEVPATHQELTRRLVAEKVLELIQDFYTEERVVQITHGGRPDAEPEQVIINAIDDAGMLVNDVSEGRYDVVISTTPRRENYDEGQFAELMDMRMNGVTIPDTVIIRHSDLTDRDEIAAEVEKLMGMAQPTEQEMEMMQMQQELAIQTAKAELDKLTAQAENFQTASALNMAKASQLAGGENSPELQLERDRLEMQIALKREELKTRVGLAQLTHSARAQGEQLRTATQLAATQFQGNVQMATAGARDKSPKKK